MDKEKQEGVLGTVADAAIKGMDAVIESVSSAASSGEAEHLEISQSQASAVH